MSYDILRHEIKNGITRGLYLFYGPEEYLKLHYCAEIERLTIEPSAKDVSYTIFEGKPDIQAISDACSAYPLFGGKRLVVLKDCGLLKQSVGGGRRRSGKTSGGAPSAAKSIPSGKKGVSLGTKGVPSETRGISSETKGIYSESKDVPSGKQKNDMSLGTVIDMLPEFTCLLIMETEVDRRLALYNQICEKGLTVDFAYRSPADLEAWVRALAGRDGVKFTRDALKLFIGNTGESMTEVRSELDKLLMYVAGRQGITTDDIAAVCRFPLKSRVFDLLDNLLAGRRRQAISELDALLHEREPAMRIISALSNHLILLRQLKNLADGGIKLPEAAKLMNLHPYRAEKLWRQSANAAPRDITRAIEQCHEQDVAIKSGHIGDVLALQLLISSISIQKAAR